MLVIVIALLFIIIGPSCFVGAFILIGLNTTVQESGTFIVKKRGAVVADERILFWHVMKT